MMQTRKVVINMSKSNLEEIEITGEVTGEETEEAPEKAEVE